MLALGASAQSLEVRDVRLRLVGDSVAIGFTLEPRGWAIARREKLTLEPVIRSCDNIPESGGTSESISKSIPGGIVIEKKLPPVTLRRSGGSISYRAVCAFEEWMGSASLWIDGSTGRHRVRTMEPIAAAENIVIAERRVEMQIVETTIPRNITAAEMIVADRGFLAPTGSGISSDGAAQIVFAPGSSTLDLAFADNRQRLVELVATIRAIENEPSLSIDGVVIRGSSVHSQIVRRFLAERTSLDPARIEALPYPVETNVNPKSSSPKNAKRNTASVKIFYRTIH